MRPPTSTRKPRSLTALATAAALAIVVCLASGCDREAPAPTGSGAPPPAPAPPLVPLETCPRGDAAWQQAIGAATDPEDAAALHRRVVAIAATCPDRWEPPWAAGECVLLTNPQQPIEVVRRARPLFERALALADAAHDPIGIARAANRVGASLLLEMNGSGAVLAYRRALTAAGEAHRRDLELFVLNNLAMAVLREGRFAEAVDLNERAAKLAAEIKPELLPRIAYNRALVLGQIGQLSEQERELNRLLDVPQLAAERNQILVALGNMHTLLGEREQARRAFDAVSASDEKRRAFAEFGLGRVALRDERLAEAREHFGRAAVQQFQPSLALFARAAAADATLRAGDASSAQKQLAAIVREADAAQIRDVAWYARLIEGQAILATRGSRTEAARLFADAVEIVESLGTGLDPGGGGMTYLRERAEPFPELAATLVDRGGDMSDPLRVVERAHARTLRQLLHDRAGPAGTTDLTELRARLTPGDLLLDYLVGEDRGVLLAVSRNDVRGVAVPGWRVLRQPVQRYLAALKRPLTSAEARLDPMADLTRDLGVGRELRERLLGPVEDLVARAQRLFVVPDQDLALVPFAALPSREADAMPFLGQTATVTMLPMAGVPARWDAERTGILIAGDPLPDAGGEFPSLPLASRELTDIAAVWSGYSTTRLSGPALTVARLAELPLASFGALHFATHALASSRDPDRCAVVLSRGERLSVDHVAQLTLGPALVVLSACRTGEGEIVPGEGVVGLSWAFLAAGAHAVVASLWSVEDASTTELMVGFHRRLRSGQDVPLALALAQRDVARTRPHPVFWAPFILVAAPAGSSAGRAERAQDAESSPRKPG